MSIIVTDNKKVYERPASGAYIGVVADVVDKGIVSTKFGEKAKVRFVWVLGKLDGTGYVLDSEKKPIQVIAELNASVNEKSDMFKTIRGILGTAPTSPFDAEVLIGRSNQLFVVVEKSADGTKEYANVKGILPLPQGVSPLAIPADFVRFKDRKAVTTVASAAPVAQAAPIAQTAAPQTQQAADPTKPVEF